MIEINGKRYDAVSGAVVSNDQKSKAQPAQESRYVDGFRRSADTAVVTPVTKAAKRSASIKRNAATHVAPHKPESARTLMRSAVKKPDIKAPARLKAGGRTDILTRVPAQTVAPKLSHTNVDPKRLKKATQMIKSPAVSRYAALSRSSAASAVSPFVTPAHSTPTVVGHARPTTAPEPAPPLQIPVSPVRQHAKQPDIFEQALSRATSHEQKFDDRKLSKKRNRIAGLTTAAMSLLLVAGILAYLNAPMISVRLASSKAGFSARLPGYSPAGFSFGNLSYGPGNVTVSYNDETATDKKFDITQRVSNWDSQALLTNFVSSANKAYQTYERAGRTIYFYGNNTATWVDNGVWFTVNGNNSLNKNQLLDLAGSI